MSLRTEGRIAVPVCISADHPSLPGHFPGEPVVPGVVLLDRLMEAAEASLGAPMQVLTLPQVKFLAPLLPGEEAIAQLELVMHGAAAVPASVQRGTSPESPPGSAVHGAVQPASASTHAASSMPSSNETQPVRTLRFRVERAGQLIAQGTFQIAGESTR